MFVFYKYRMIDHKKAAEARPNISIIILEPQNWPIDNFEAYTLYVDPDILRL